MSEPVVVSLDHYRQRAEQEHGNKHLSLADGTNVTLRRPMRMPKEQRERMYAAQAAVRQCYKEHPDLEAARLEHARAVDSRQKLPANAHKGTVEKRDQSVVDAWAKVEALWEQHGKNEATQTEELIAALRGLFEAIADPPDAAARMLDEIDDDLYVLQIIIGDWDKATEPGEASPSPS